MSAWKVVALAAVVVALVYGALLIKRAWFYSGTLLGALTVGYSPEHRHVYRLRLAGRVVGYVSGLDSWYVEKHYAYGTASAEPGGPDAFFLFDCRAQRYDMYSSREAFRVALEREGLPWQNFMSGENVLAMKYNRRRFSSQCH